MGARESGKDQLAGIGLTLSDLHFGDALVHLLELVHVGEVQLRVNALGPHIHGQGDHIHITGTLAVSEQRGFHALCTGQKTELCSGNASTAVVVGVQRNDSAVAIADVAHKHLQHIGGVVGHHVFHGGGKIENDRIFPRSAQFLHDALADGNGVFHLGPHPGFRGILVADVHAGIAGQLLICELFDEPCALHSNVDNTVHIHLKDHLPLQRRGGVVEMDNDIFGTVDSLKGLFDKMRPCLHQNLNPYIVRNVAAVDELAQDFVLGF